MTSVPITYNLISETMWNLFTVYETLEISSLDEGFTERKIIQKDFKIN